MRLRDKVAVVTGGATGIGRSVCEVFAREGARVMVNYNSSADAANEVVAGIADRGGEAFAFQASVSKEPEVKALMQAAVDRWGKLDILVNNAGWSKLTPHHQLDDLTEEIWDRTLNTNLRGTFYCMRAAAPLLKQQPGASIVNIASIAPFTGEGSTIVYAASKAGVISMTKSFARVLAPDVRVNAIAPGLIETRFAGWTTAHFERAAEYSPLKRIVKAEEVGELALFLAADATGITGETIVIDSGVTSLRRA
jgi:3-oxoacyl-[acyl-carrier protein] reductase